VPGAQHYHWVGSPSTPGSRPERSRTRPMSQFLHLEPKSVPRTSLGTASPSPDSGRRCREDCAGLGARAVRGAPPRFSGPRRGGPIPRCPAAQESGSGSKVPGVPSAWGPSAFLSAHRVPRAIASLRAARPPPTCALLLHPPAAREREGPRAAWRRGAFLCAGPARPLPPRHALSFEYPAPAPVYLHAPFCPLIHMPRLAPFICMPLPGAHSFARAACRLICMPRPCPVQRRMPIPAVL
jgi:hypothetical protein